MEHPFDGKQACQCFSGRKLGAVEESEPLLGTEHKGCEPGAPERGIGRHGLAGEPRFADAEHRRREVGEWGEIARCSHRALARDHRHDPAFQHGLEHGDGLRPHAGGAVAEARELERHHQPRIRVLHRLADAGGVRQHDVTLQHQ